MVSAIGQRVTVFDQEGRGRDIEYIALCGLPIPSIEWLGYRALPSETYSVIKHWLSVLRDELFFKAVKWLRLGVR